MTSQDKVREELMKELNESRQSNISLKDEYEKRLAGCLLLNESLQDEIDYLDAIFKSSPVSMLLLDENTTVIKANKAALLLSGYSENETLQHRPGNALGCVHGLEDPRGCGYSKTCKLCPIRNSIESLLVSGGSLHGAEVQLTLIRKGRPRKVWLEVSAEIMQNHEHRYLCVSMNDITRRKHNEIKLHEKDALLNITGLTAKVGGWEFDTETLNQTWTEEVYRIHELDTSFDPNVSNGINFYAPVSRPVIGEAVQRIIEFGEPFDLELEFFTSKGNHRWVHSIGKAQNENGKIQKVYGSIQDITEQKRAEAEIKRQNEELQKINAEKDKFFSIIAHDLRSPFNGFLGLTEVLSEDLPSQTTVEIQEIALRMNKSASNLYRLLNNLLEWSQIQKGTIPFEPKEIQLRIVGDDSIAAIMELAIIKDIEITSDIPVNLLAFADTNMIQTVIRNLISNAVKFTPRGGKVSLAAKTNEDKSIEISVQDNGIGMSQDLLENLFRIDIQTSRKGTEKEPGTGLGLLLCKEFVDKHEGRIWAESEAGNGSKFYFTLPFHNEFVS
jgi:signal transduction histidine kinase